ncbi:hypothetical protein BC938DRAFT_471465 [Jimgerdemannia flammicorona]|uniref:Uncharacterized protein n=1 Tax=Jimgerdemannia flammicorona TaxID=994334 RepID=A0A433Q831_9FUNG|nr:hypothetical protein BC938DRAFT_471465 [Jimgerdemannia flammicorona]
MHTSHLRLSFIIIIIIIIIIYELIQFAVPGRPYLVEIYDSKTPKANYLWAAITQVLTIHVTQRKGDILMLTGQDEIESAEEGYDKRLLGSKIGELIIYPIYADLASEMPNYFDVSIILKYIICVELIPFWATNIAETSITVDSVSYVIDPGFSNLCHSLLTHIGHAASRLCWSYGSWEVLPAMVFYNEMDENTIPDIQRTNLGNTVLTLKVCTPSLALYSFSRTITS